MHTVCESEAKRCAVYTRKSTIDRFERDFNSLKSQREVCSAYIKSQGYKGWVELPKRYDDAAQSGATLDRSALQELIADIESGLVDVVVIYKIDRLTRSLGDFLRLMEVFERSSASFVSVTQSFDTSDSMGRLVLNILLTFAQFEREMIADRIRDKLEAMKRRGMWTGGVPPYGYDVIDRRLVINKAEAAQVDWLFRRFLELGSYTKVCREVQRNGMRAKEWIDRKGRSRGGGVVSSGMVYNLLGNCIYIGKVKSRELTFEGEHEAIIAPDIWEAAQQLRTERSMYKVIDEASPNILLGLLYDSFGRPMQISDTRKPGHRYRYYVSNQALWAKGHGVKRARTNADEIEKLVLACVQSFLNSRDKVRSALLKMGIHGKRLDALGKSGAQASERIDIASVAERRRILHALIVTIELSEESLGILFRCSEVSRLVQWDGQCAFQADQVGWSQRQATILEEIPVKALRFRRSIVMPVEPAIAITGRQPDRSLVSLIKEARQAQSMVDTQRSESLAELAAKARRQPGYFARLLRLNYLAPDIIASIIDGTQPAALTRKRLIKSNLPMDWALQRALFGFAPRADHSLAHSARYERRKP